MKRALVCGAGGFIAGHLVKRLKADGYWVRGVDLKAPEFAASAADEFRLLDLRELDRCQEALQLDARASTRSTSSPPTWAAWGSSTRPSARSCATACS
jgi:nucleoside-diphosphate-sugar epimerase